jgi:glutamate racemase
LANAAPDVRVLAVACPLFVPLAEEGWTNGEVPRLVAEHYLGALKGNVDTAILGCTHYPLLAEVIAETLPGVRLVDSASATAETLRTALGPERAGDEGRAQFLVTDHVERFRDVGERFLGVEPSPVRWVDVGPPSGAFLDALPG